MDAVYESSNSFLVADDKTDEFVSGRRVKADCETDGVFYSAVISSTFSSPNTTVVIEDEVLTSNLKDVLYGAISSDEQGSLPNHSHSTVPGDGGQIEVPSLEEIKRIAKKNAIIFG